MRYSAKTLDRSRTAVVALFSVVCIGFFALLWAKSGGDIPGVTGYGYKLSAVFPNIGNLAHASDVQMAGVPIGSVGTITTEPNGVKVTMTLHRDRPLHQGATVTIESKTLINESYVQIVDGTGAAYKSGVQLPAKAVQNYTSLNDVFNAIQPADQTAAKQLLTEFNSATAGQQGNIQATLAALGNLGLHGQTVFDVLANQTQDLQQLVNQTGTLMGVLDEGQGQIGDLASSAEEVSQATANSQAALASTVQELPTTIRAAQSATGSIQELSSALDPVATNLQAAAPTLNQALITLPSTTTSLRTLVNPLNTTLDRAPATLANLPKADQTLTNLLPSTAYALSNLDPIVGYLAPYKQDLISFFSNFGAAADHADGVGGVYGDVQLLTFGSNQALPLPTNLQYDLDQAQYNPTPPPGVGQSNPTDATKNVAPPSELGYPAKPKS